MSALSPEQSTAIVRRFWDAVGKREFDACGKMLAKNMIRSGPRALVADDTVTGGQEYEEFIRRVISAMPSYHNVTQDIVSSSDGRRVYLQCTEWPSSGQGKENEIEVPLVLVCDLNDNSLITKIDIYWKNPKMSVEWTMADEIMTN